MICQRSTILKKLIIIVLIIFSGITSSFAVFFVDGQGFYAATGDYEPVSGFGIGIGLSLTDDINFLIKGITGSNTENKDKTDELSYDYNIVTGGIEYIPPIDILNRYRLYWKNSLNLGWAEFKSEMPEVNDSDKSDMGFHLSFWTGLQFNFTQYIAPFIDLGYHKTFFSVSNSDLSISGWQAAFGVRFYIGGSRDYSTGY